MLMLRSPRAARAAGSRTVRRMRTKAIRAVIRHDNVVIEKKWQNCIFNACSAAFAHKRRFFAFLFSQQAARARIYAFGQRRSVTAR